MERPLAASRARRSEQSHFLAGPARVERGAALRDGRAPHSAAVSAADRPRAHRAPREREPTPAGAQSLRLAGPEQGGERWRLSGFD